MINLSDNTKCDVCGHKFEDHFLSINTIQCGAKLGTDKVTKHIIMNLLYTTKSDLSINIFKYDTLYTKGIVFSEFDTILIDDIFNNTDIFIDTFTNLYKTTEPNVYDSLLNKEKLYTQHSYSTKYTNFTEYTTPIKFIQSLLNQEISKYENIHIQIVEHAYPINMRLCQCTRLKAFDNNPDNRYCSKCQHDKPSHIIDQSGNAICKICKTCKTPIVWNEPSANPVTTDNNTSVDDYFGDNLF